MRVAVIGAGLGGLCLAQGLRGAGIEVEVSERDPAITARFQGYRLMLSPVGLEALRGCLPPRWHPLLDAIVGDAAASGLVLDPQLNRIGEIGPARTGIVVDRDVLRRLLLTGLTVHTGAALTGYRVTAGAGVPGNDPGSVGVRAEFAGCAPANADVLVGADGVNSAVRAALAPALVPTDTGVRFVIGRTPLRGPFAEMPPHVFGSKITGNGLSLLLGAMRFRTPPKEAAERLAPEVTLPDVQDYVRWAMILPPDGSIDTTPQEAVLSRIDGWHPDLRALIEQSDPDNSTLLSIRVVEPRQRWAPGPVTLLGDAVHATSPTGGNGANTALRDADLLRTRLTDVARGTRDLAAAIDDYETQMFAYGSEAVQQGLRALPMYTTDRA